MAEGILDPERGSLNKWEMYKVLRDGALGDCRLPYTAPWQPQTFADILSRFHQLYLKPLGTWGGRGISLVTVNNSGIRWTSQGADSQQFPSSRQLVAHLLTVYTPLTAIVQQAAPLLRCNGRVFDIRVLMQRELDDSWITAGMLCRVGGDDAVVSNVGISQGSVWPLQKALRAALPRRLQTRKQLAKIEDQLAATSHNICEQLTPYRHFHEVGIDFGIDELGHLWLIEVNTDDALGAPSHELFAKLPDASIYEEIQRRRQAYQMQTVRWLLDALDTPDTPDLSTD